MSSSSSEFPRLGRYEVIDRIAAGGMAEVFLARAVGAMGFHRLVAVKLIHANFTRDPEFVKMFIDEARIAMHLHHRNIVQVFDLDKVDGTYFLAMEYVKGVNLYDLYERIAAQDRWIEVPMALYLVAEVCKGLHFAHTRTSPGGRPLGIIHRDISPQNVLLSFEGEVKITDFGIATAAERLHQTAAGIVKGKYAYMAPERLQEAPVDSRVDVFSAGVLLYELLVGENPFAGPSAVDTIEAVLSGSVPPPSTRGAPVPQRLDEICLKALAKTPHDRWPSAQAFADALTELAMELTYARKDMASGDAAVATLLAELFPDERAARADGAEPGSIDLPGVDRSALEDTARPGELSVGFLIGGLDEEGGPPDDLDAPTVLRSSPVVEELGVTSRPEQDSWQSDSGDTPLDEPVGEQTEPTQLPDGPGGFQPTLQTAAVTPSQAADLLSIPTSDEWRRSARGRPESAADRQKIRTEAEPETWHAKDSRRRLQPNVDHRGPGASESRPPDSARQGSRAPLADPVEEDDPYASTLPVGANETARIDTVSMAEVTAEPPRAPPRSRPPMPLATTPPPNRRVPDPAEARPARATPTPMPLARPQPPSSGSRDLEPIPPSPTSKLRRWVAPVILLALAAASAAVVATLLNKQQSQIVEVPVEFRSSPSGAQVQLNGRLLPDRTPTQASVLAGVELEARFSLENYESVVKRMVPSERRSSVIKARLRPLSRPPTLEAIPKVRKVTLRPKFGRWAKVYRNGRSLGSTPVTVDLPVGKVQLEVVPEGKGPRRIIQIVVPESGDDEIPLDL